jgi:chemotaxis protein histidine kinase CheA
MMPPLRKRKPPVLDTSLDTSDRDRVAASGGSARVLPLPALRAAGNRAMTGALSTPPVEQEPEDRSRTRVSVLAAAARESARGGRPPAMESVTIVEGASQSKGVASEVQLPFHDVYRDRPGSRWNQFAGGTTTESSRANIARRSSFDERMGQEASAGIDFLAQNIDTARLVIGEQKAWTDAEFRSATAITTHLEKNVDAAIAGLNRYMAEGKVHPDAVADFTLTIKRLEDTKRALHDRTDLPDGVVFEFTTVGGESTTIGREHVELLEGAFPNDPKFVEHLLDRTFVRNPELARQHPRDPKGTPGTDTDPDIVPAKELLTEGAHDALARIRAGKTKAEWAKQQKQERARARKAEKTERQNARKAQKAERKATERRVEKEAAAIEKEVTKERLKQLKEERAQAGVPEPKTPKQRERENRRLKREAETAGKEAADKHLDAFYEQRKQQEAAARAEKTAETERQKTKAREERQRNRDEVEARQIQEEIVRAERETARTQAEKEQGLAVGETKESTKALKEQVESRNKARKRDQALGHAAEGANELAAYIRAWDAYQEALEQKRGHGAALSAAVLTYLENTNVVFGAVAGANAKQKDGQDAVEAWLSTIGETGAGFAYGGAGWDQALNAFVNLLDAADDHFNPGVPVHKRKGTLTMVRSTGDVVADVTPSRLLSQTVGGGLRGYYNIVKDLLPENAEEQEKLRKAGKAPKKKWAGTTKFSEDALQGKLGSAFVFPAMMAEFGSNLASDDAGTALEKAVKKSEGAATTKLGYASGDALYEFGQNEEIKAGKKGMAAQGWSQMVGMASDMIAGNSLQRSMEKAAASGKGSTANKIGEKIADATYEFGQNERLKAGKGGMAVQGLSQLVGMASDLTGGASLEKAMQNAAAAGKGSLANKIGEGLADAAWDAIEKGQDIVNEDLPAAKKKAKQALNSLVTFLGGN